MRPALELKSRISSRSTSASSAAIGAWSGASGRGARADIAAPSTAPPSVRARRVRGAARALTRSATAVRVRATMRPWVSLGLLPELTHVRDRVADVLVRQALLSPRGHLALAVLDRVEQLIVGLR